MSDYIKILIEKIKLMHGCDSEHIGSEKVTEQFNGQTVWQGIVEVFKLINHRLKAKKCYAWGFKNNKNKEDYVAVLELPPVDSAKKAVQIYIASEAKKQASKSAS